MTSMSNAQAQRLISANTREESMKFFNRIPTLEELALVIMEDDEMYQKVLAEHEAATAR